MDRSTRRRLLESNMAELAAEIDVEKIARELCERDVIGKEIRDLIMGLKTNKDQMAKLVDVLKITKPSKYEVFCDVLRQQGHEKLAQQLMPPKSREGSRPNTKRNPRGVDAKRVSSSTASGSYTDVFKRCRNIFISDVAADPDCLVRKLDACKEIMLSGATKRQIEREPEPEAKAEILFDAILPQVNEYVVFFDIVQALRDPFQHLSNELWEQLKNIVVPLPKSANGFNSQNGSAGSYHSLPATPGSMRESPNSAGNGASNDVMKSLTNLQSDLTESQSDSLKQSLQLERCIQTTAEANNAIKKLKAQLKVADEEREIALAQSDAARQHAAESRQQLKMGLAEAEAERTKLDEQHRKWEGQMRRRMAVLEQKETYLASKEAELRRREEEQKQRNQLQRRQHESLEKKGLEMVQKGDRQDLRSAESHVRENKLKERENNVVVTETQLCEREDEIGRKEKCLKRKDIDLRRKEIEFVRLEENVKMMQNALRKSETHVKQREKSVAQAEEDIKTIGDNLQQREESLTVKESKLEVKTLELKRMEEKLQHQQAIVEMKERQIQEMEREMRDWESEIEAKSQELGNITSEANQKEQELLQQEEGITNKKKELDSLQNILDRRLQAQEKMERALVTIAMEQIRRDRNILDREAEYLQMNLPSPRQMEELANYMDKADKKDEDPKKQDELLTWNDVEEQRREIELLKQQIMKERARREEEPQDNHRTDMESVPLSEDTLHLDADPEPEMFDYEVVLKGARAAKRGSKGSFEIKVPGEQTVAAFKAILETEEGIPDTWQSLFLHGQYLEDSMKMPSTCTSTPGGVQKIDLKLASPPIKDRDVLKLKVKSCNGPTHTIEFSTEDSVALAKTRIYKYTAIPPHQQLLSYKEVLLENHASLQHYSIRKNATLDLRLRFPVKAELSGNQHHLITVDETNIIANIKAAVFEKTKLPLDNLKVSYKGKQLEDHRTLAHYNIDEGAILNVTCSVVVKMHATNTDIHLDLEPGATVQQLKQHLSRRKNISIDRMYIVCGGDQILSDDQDVTEVIRSGKDIGAHVGNVLVMSSSGQILRDTEEQQAGNQTDRSLDLSVSGKLSMSQVAR